MTIDCADRTWEEILSLAMGGTAQVVTDTDETAKVTELILKKFPQAADDLPASEEERARLPH